MEKIKEGDKNKEEGEEGDNLEKVLFNLKHDTLLKTLINEADNSQRHLTVSKNYIYIKNCNYKAIEVRSYN